MKKIILSAIVAFSSVTAFAGVSGFNGETQTEIVRLGGFETAVDAYQAAQDFADMINSDPRGFTKFKELKRCNPTAGDFDDSKFHREASTYTSKVGLNHVTGMYSTTVRVDCED